MLDELASKRNGVLLYVVILAELHISIHSQEMPDMPSKRDMIGHRIRCVKMLSKEERTRALQVLNQMTDGTILCQ